MYASNPLDVRRSPETSLINDCSNALQNMGDNSLPRID